VAITNVVIIGKGRAGLALRRSLKAAGCSVRLVSSRRLPAHLDTELVLLCVPEPVIATIVVPVDDDVLVCHVAGSVPTTALTAKRRGVFHPLASLQRGQGVPAATLFGIEAQSDGDRRRLFALARRIGGRPVRVSNEQRTRYHAGAVIAGNLATALLQLGIDELVAAGIDEGAARRGLAQLLRSTAEAAVAKPLREALTGPVARGSAATVSAHLEVITDPASRDLYAALSSVLVHRVAKLTTTQRRSLKSVLERLDGPT
jgi:predicted short-subunit dehydrogenase-like oxidoreductase (DUF2520 family)